MKRRQLSIITLLIFALGVLLWNNKTDQEFIYNEGLIFGTSYHISYHSPNEIDYNLELRQQLLDVVDNSLSTFNKHSIISKINNNEAHKTDSAFEKVYLTAQKISELSDGAFDITVAPLANRWGFGYSKKQESLPTEEEIAQLLQIVGYKKIKLEQHQLIKEHQETQLDGSAIAKGFAVDVAAEFLESKDISNYMVEIGGEIRVSGTNSKGTKWRLGIDRPIEDPAAFHREIDTVLNITDKAIASSGNYRQFYYNDGKKYSHTINPITGYPVQHSLLSATVIASDCMSADAIATACMVMGAEKGLALAEKLEDVDVYFIIDDNGEFKELFSKGMTPYFQP